MLLLLPRASSDDGTVGVFRKVASAFQRACLALARWGRRGRRRVGLCLRIVVAAGRRPRHLGALGRFGAAGVVSESGNLLPG
jgi:hypothetical protein